MGSSFLSIRRFVALAAIYGVFAASGPTLASDDEARIDGEISRVERDLEFSRTMEQMVIAARKDASALRFQRQMLEQSLQRLQAEKAELIAQRAVQQQAAGPVSTASNACKTSLAHLSPRLPVYQVDQLQQVRSAILAEDLNGTLSRARSQGLSTAQAASMSLQAANNADDEVRKGVNCIRNFASSPESVIDALENGVFRFSSTRMGDLNINESCAAQYVVLKYTAVATRESAVQMACLAQSR